LTSKQTGGRREQRTPQKKKKKLSLSEKEKEKGESTEAGWRAAKQ